MIDWSRCKPRELTEIIRSIPSIAEPWKHKKLEGDDEVVERWERRLWCADTGYRAPFQICRTYDGWQGWWNGNALPATKHESLSDSIEASDKVLSMAGYILDNDLPCNVEDGVTESCRGCNRLKRDHQTFPNDPKP